MYPLLAVSLFLIPMPADAESRRKSEPVLWHRYEGDKLIVMMTVTVQNSDHIVLTGIDNTDALAPGLRYTIIQNAHVLAFTKKEVTVEWRFHKSVAVPNRVSGQVIKLTPNELTQLGGKAADLAKEPKNFHYEATK